MNNLLATFCLHFTGTFFFRNRLYTTGLRSLVVLLAAVQLEILHAEYNVDGHVGRHAVYRSVTEGARRGDDVI